MADKADVLEALKHSNVFLTGGAGVGKSYITNEAIPCHTLKGIQFFTKYIISAIVFYNWWQLKKVSHKHYFSKVTVVIEPIGYHIHQISTYH